MSSSPSLTASAQRDSLPLGGLLALASAGFITILTEAMPAGLLPQIGEGLGVSPALVGQLVTVYALGSLLAAIPLTLLTRGLRRRPLLLMAIGGFALVNSVTALSSHYGLTLVARFFAGVFAGLLWALLAGMRAEWCRHTCKVAPLPWPCWVHRWRCHWVCLRAPSSAPPLAGA